jgi:hypothetical protein
VAYTPKPKFLQVVVDYGDGSEHQLDATPGARRKRPMAQPGTQRLPLVKARIDHLFALTERAYDLAAHWNEGLKNDLDTAGAALKSACDYLATLPAGFVAPRKPVTRKFNLLQPGDIVRLTEKGESRYMGKLKGKPLTVVSITDGWAEVQLEGDPQKPTVETKHLVAA